MKLLRGREKEERAVASKIAPVLLADDKSAADDEEDEDEDDASAAAAASVPPTAFLLEKAERQLGEEPEGKTTLQKLEWIADKLQIASRSEAALHAQEVAKADAEAAAAQAQVEQKNSAWKEQRQGYAMGGSSLDGKMRGL